MLNFSLNLQEMRVKLPEMGLESLELPLIYGDFAHSSLLI